MSSTVPAIGGLAERSALDALLQPRSVAIIGASRNRVAVVMSSGFGEGMGAGEGILVAVAAELAATGMRILGPNCEGLASLPADAPLTFSPVLDMDASGTRLRAGNIAVISQSGGLGFAVAQWGTAAGLDFNYIVSTGTSWTSTALSWPATSWTAPTPTS
jgi:acyl-CoA synthetase (NDP forming)